VNVFKKIGKVAVAVVTLPVKIVMGVVLISKFRDKS
jgi:hypothetical protein